MTTAYPLAWPDGWPRTSAYRREDGKGKFRRINKSGSGRDPYWTFPEARDTLFDEVRKLGATEGRTVLSSNFPIGRDGFALSPKARPEDQGVAIYFQLDGKSLVMAQDRYTRAEENMRSLALAVEAMRQLDRHGGGVMMERAFTGFAALPPPTAKRTWFEVLGISKDAGIDAIRAAHREKVMSAHPDRGGSQDAMAELNAARDEGIAARSVT